MSIKYTTQLLESITKFTVKPPLFSPSEPPGTLFWDDPYISQSMLETHLNPDTDLASRQPETLDKQVNHLTACGIFKKGDRLLDIGCGPGLIANRLAAKSIEVTGIDISRNSLDYAITQARTYGLDIQYRLLNFLDMDYTSIFDAALQSYCEIGTLSDENRDALFTKVYRALKPGGVFVFDLTTPHLKTGPCPRHHWHILEGGFWRPSRHMTMEMRFDYPEDNIFLSQTIIIDEEKLTVYRIWNHNYTPETISLPLEKAGFRIQHIWNDLTGTPYREGGEVLAVAVIKV